MTIRCHEFLGCYERQCVMFGKGESRNCWEVPPALTVCLARTSGNITMEEKKYFCKSCLYYEYRERNKG